jgi:hypothetical protein
MASKSEKDLLTAIEGYTKEHKGSKTHEPMIDQLGRVHDEIANHKGGGPASPGSLAAKEVGEQAMSGESSQSPGDGQKRSNEPGHAGAPDPLADIAGPDGRDDRMKGVAAVPSGGIRSSNQPSSGMAPGTMEIRRIAADREKSRPDSKLKPGPTGGKDDNKDSNPHGDGYPAAARIGDAQDASYKRGSPAEAQRAGREAQDQPEDAPPRVPQQRDAFVAAREQAKKKLATANK